MNFIELEVWEGGSRSEYNGLGMRIQKMWTWKESD